MSSISSSSAVSESYPLNSHPSRGAAVNRSRPPPPLQLQNQPYRGSFSSTQPADRRSFSLQRDKGMTSPTTLLYELPPSMSSPRLSTTSNAPRNTRTAGGVQSLYYYAQRSPPPSSASRPHLASPPPRSQSPPSAPSANARHSLQHPRPSSSFGMSYDSQYTQNAPTPPPRPRSLTPSLLTSSNQDMNLFAQNCKAWFFENDEVAGSVMSSTLDGLPPSMRATYMRLQASIRSAFHVSQSLRRLTEFRALLSSTLPGQSLPANVRIQPAGSTARKERLSRLMRFISNHCLQNSPGTHAFFEALYAFICLQYLPANLGGAGEHRIEWEVDDAVFIESAGRDFTRDAIDILKGVLGLEETLITIPSADSTMNLNSAGPSPCDTSDTTALISLQPSPTRIKPVVPPRVRKRTVDSQVPTITSPSSPATPTQGQLDFPDSLEGARVVRSESRSRTVSDPFIDPGKSSSGSGSTYASPLSRAATSKNGSQAILEGDLGALDSAPGRKDFDPSPINRYGPPTPLEETGPTVPLKASHSHTRSDPLSSISPVSPPLLPRRLSMLEPTLDGIIPTPTAAEMDLLNNQQLRVWKSPLYYSNPELASLMGVFPAFITKKAVSRFTPVTKATSERSIRGGKDPMKTLEEGGSPDESNTEGSTQRDLRGEVKNGTGRMWVSEDVREEGWRGGLWSRIMGWLRALFCR